MPNIVQGGYTQDAYTTDPYTSGQIAWGIRSQINRQITTPLHPVHSQVKRQIAALHAVHQQIARTITALHKAHEQINQQISNNLHKVHSQTKEQIASTHRVREQILRKIAMLHAVHEQISRTLKSSHNLNEQVNRTINGTLHRLNSQIKQQISSNAHRVKEQIARTAASKHPVHEQVLQHPGTAFHRLNEEIRAGSVLFLTLPAYTEFPYAQDPYTASQMAGHLRSQIRQGVDGKRRVSSQIARTINNSLHRGHEQIYRQINVLHKVHESVARTLNLLRNKHEQIQRKISTLHPVHEQSKRRIDVIHRVHEQINRLQAHILHSQVTIALYNITNLRVLLNFPSRGTSGSNWTSNSTASGDFSILNVNTDIVEQVWRSASTVKTGIVLTCDTQVTQGVFVDTMAFLNHNFTTSATITWEKSNDAGFATIGEVENLTSALTNMYFIAPMLPQHGYRYHRFLIDDPTNTANFLQIGTIVFGSAIMLQGDNFVDQVKKQLVHFADKILTEGFTNVSNDRALKTNIGLEFKNLDFNSGNYTKLETIFTTARTSLKCLWIPTPQYPSRYAIFGKLATLPDETHNDLGDSADYVSLSVQIDESL